MHTVRVIPCLDVREGKTTKGVKFEGNKNIGAPVEMAKKYYLAGADELVFYDITASAEKRMAFLDIVEEVASQIFIPLTVGGGIRNLEDARKTIGAGAEKISVNSQAVKNPKIISDAANVFGAQCIVLGVDVKATDNQNDYPSGYRVWINGGRLPTNLDAMKWITEAIDRGAGEICLNGMDTDGVQEGYNLPLTKMVSENTSVPVIASGGAGKEEHFADVVKVGKADAVLVASVLHYDIMTIAQIKKSLSYNGIKIRTTN